LASAQIRLRRVEHCRKIFLASLCALLFSVVTLYAIDRSGPGPAQEAAHILPQAQSQDVYGREVSPISLDERNGNVSKLPFAVRSTGPNAFGDELINDWDATVTNVANPIPNKADRQGEFFLVEIEETERTTIDVAAFSEKRRVERIIVISGYAAKQAPCDRRTIYFPKGNLAVTPNIFALATKTLGDTSHCGSIDKALVIWDWIREIAGTSNFILPGIKNARSVIEYNWARGNYQACDLLGYEQQCDIAKAAFERFNKVGLNVIGVSERDKKMVQDDINSIPLRIAYLEVRRLFGLRDYRTAATSTEELLIQFDNKVEYWKHINISKSRLYADAAVSWLHHGDALTSVSDRRGRCESFERALYNAKKAAWFNFRQEHVPLIEQRLVNCGQDSRQPS
jgi:hypothetical protein